MEKPLRSPFAKPFGLMVGLLIVGASLLPDANWVMPPKSSAMALVPVLSAAPSDQLPIESVGGLGVVLVRAPVEGSKLSVTDPDVVVPVWTVGSDGEVGSPNVAVQVLVPVFVQVIWTVLGVPSESYTVIELVRAPWERWPRPPAGWPQSTPRSWRWR